MSSSLPMGDILSMNVKEKKYLLVMAGCTIAVMLRSCPNLLTAPTFAMKAISFSWWAVIFGAADIAAILLLCTGIVVYFKVYASLVATLAVLPLIGYSCLRLIEGWGENPLDTANLWAAWCALHAFFIVSFVDETTSSPEEKQNRDNSFQAMISAASAESTINRMALPSKSTVPGKSKNG